MALNSESIPAAKPQQQATACMLCAINCGVLVETDGKNQITKVIGDKAHPVSAGYVCEKAQRINYYQNGADRINSPMRRCEDGSYEAVDWDTAIREVAAGLQGVKQRHGGESILYYGGGGQGNHIGGAYGDALLKALNVKYRSNALAQEKTGEFWVAGNMLGTGSHGDFEHCDLALFIGKNPWQSHGFPRARIVLKEIAKDPKRKMIVIDPRVTETAKMADYHLQLKPGTDAWCLSALAGILVQENLVDHEWMAEHTAGFEAIEATLEAIPVSEYAKICGVDEALMRETAAAIGAAKNLSAFEDLGLQMAPHSTLSSYLQRLLWLTTGHYGRQGTTNAFVPFLSLSKASKGETSSKKNKGPRVEKRSPVTGSKIIIGLIPCNVIPDEILTDHPDRFRALIVESGNPLHSLADSQRMREAMRAVEFSVVIDVAMTETAREASYVLPASSQFEKVEGTFFSTEFPRNAFQLRQPLFEPMVGTLSEAEIHARLIEEMGLLTKKDYRPLQAAAKLGLTAYSAAFVLAVTVKPSLMKYVSVLLYRTLGPTLPKGMATAAVLWGICLMFIQSNAQAAKRAGFSGPLPIAANRLFKALLDNPSGVVFAESTFEASWKSIGHPGHRINLHIAEMLAELKQLGESPQALLAGEKGGNGHNAYPYILSAGERRTETSNTAVRDSSWHKKPLFAALRLSPADAESLGCSTGDTVKLTTNRASANVQVEVSDIMQPGHISLPNGVGLDYRDADGNVVTKGLAPNEFTDSKNRDAFAGTPWHKYVPAKLEKVAA